MSIRCWAVEVGGPWFDTRSPQCADVAIVMDVLASQNIQSAPRASPHVLWLQCLGLQPLPRMVTGLISTSCSGKVLPFATLRDSRHTWFTVPTYLYTRYAKQYVVVSDAKPDRKHFALQFSVLPAPI